MSAVIRDRSGRFVSPGRSITHNYARYIAGCRCGVCRAAKAAYVRDSRAAAAARRRQAVAAGEVYVATDITHGVGGYQNESCRCDVCWRAAKANRIRYSRRAEMAGAS